MEMDTPTIDQAPPPVPPPPPPPPPLGQSGTSTLEMDVSRGHVERNFVGISDIEQAIKMRQKEMQFKIVGAIERQSVRLLTSLLEGGVNINAVILYTKTPLTYALELGHSDIACRLIRAGCDVEKSVETSMGLKPIHFAVLRNCSRALQELIAHNAKVNSVDCGNTTALHYACYFGFESLVDILLSNNADVTSCDDCGRTPLHRAMERGHQHIVRKLIKHGASVNTPDVFGWPPLFQSIVFNSLDSVEFLIEHNCDLNITDRHGNTALHIACDRCSPKSTTVLVSTSVEYQKRKKKIPTEEITRLLIGQNSKPCLSMIHLLVNAGACINVTNSAHETPVYLSAFSRDFRLAEYLCLGGGNVEGQWLKLYDDVTSPGSDAYFACRQMLKPLFGQQFCLPHLCRARIRQILGHSRNIHNAVSELPLPQKLKDYIDACELLLDVRN